jgi:uncharacterized LabA/DUF88 family protein
MSKVIFFIDGFNFYHALDYLEAAFDHHRYHKYKWISFRRLCLLFLRGDDVLADILYFTTLATWDPGKTARHQTFIKAQEDEGVRVIFGQFKRKEVFCKACHQKFWAREEKETDVNIALNLYDLAFKNRFDKAIIISADSDLIPAVKAVRATFPGKLIGVVTPIGKSGEDLKKQADFSFKMREHHLASCIYPDPHTLKDGTVLTCPPNWK